MTSLEETLRHIVREEMERREERFLERITERVRATASPSTDGDRLLGPHDDLCGYSWETIKKWISQGKLKRHGTRRAARVSERELKGYLARNGAAEGDGDDPGDAKILELARERAARGGKQ
jgi:hypothetical protein